jgi:fructose/tagatose bisphosphate aldolase
LEDGSSLGFELGIVEGSEDGIEDAFKDGFLLGFELGIVKGSEDGVAWARASRWNSVTAPKTDSKMAS